MSDEEILKSSYKWPARFGDLFDRHHKRFLRVASMNLRSKADAEDVVQETFVRIYKYGKKFSQNGGKFVPWANTILKNCIADQINSYKKKPLPLTEELEAVTPNPETKEDPEIDKKNDYIRFVLDKLDGATAQIINLRFVLGKSFKEIGKIMKIKSGTARVRIYRSKKLFMQFYKQFNNYE